MFVYVLVLGIARIKNILPGNPLVIPWNHTKYISMCEPAFIQNLISLFDSLVQSINTST